MQKKKNKKKTQYIVQLSKNYSQLAQHARKDYKNDDLKCMDTPPTFSVMFSKGDNFCDFLFVRLVDKIFSIWGLLSDGSKIFPL